MENEETILGKGWNDSDRIMQERSSSAWLKVEDGKSILLNVCGDPVVYEKAFGDEEPRARVKVNVFVIGENAHKTWDMSRTTFDQLKRQRHRRGNTFDDAVLELGRTGTEKLTKYWLDYVRQLSAVELAARGEGANSDIPF